MKGSQALATHNEADRTGLERSFDLSERDFGVFCEQIYRLSGIVLADNKRQLVTSRLRKRLMALGLSGFAQYRELLESPKGEAESAALVNAISTNHTGFFRERHHFLDLVDQTRLPRRADGRKEKLRIWSAACSSGEEPYTITFALERAGVLEEYRNVRILATDIDTRILEKARSALFSRRKVSVCSDEVRRDAFDALGPDQFRVKPHLRELIVFNQLNLLRPWPMKGQFDAIFCRNVLIYFDEATKTDIVERMVDLLRPGGTLYLGHSESLLGKIPALSREGQCIFRKT